MKLYLHTQPILTTPITSDILGLSLGILDFAINVVLFKKVDQVEKLIYYFSKTLQPTEARYQPIKILTFVVVTVAKTMSLISKHIK